MNMETKLNLHMRIKRCSFLVISALTRLAVFPVHVAMCCSVSKTYVNFCSFLLKKKKL